MNPINDLDTAREQARKWSARLGELSANTQSHLRQPAPTRLTAALADLLQRRRAQEDAEHKLKIHEFITG